MESKTEIHVKSFDSILKLIAAKHARSWILNIEKEEKYQ
jgi:hypothetical protein